MGLDNKIKNEAIAAAYMKVDGHPMSCKLPAAATGPKKEKQSAGIFASSARQPLPTAHDRVGLAKLVSILLCRCPRIHRPAFDPKSNASPLCARQEAVSSRVLYRGKWKRKWKLLQWGVYFYKNIHMYTCLI